MFVPFLIMLREGLEAALIVSLIASYLKRTQRGRWIGVMWIGVILAAACNDFNITYRPIRLITVA